MQTSVNGIAQSDILIRSAVIQALADIKANPWLLDYAFAFLVNDSLTRATYGDKELADIKKWFMETEISVTMAYRVDRPQLPCIGIELVESVESGANALGDIHNEEVFEDQPPTDIIVNGQPVLGPFTPKAYNIATGQITLPDNLATDSIFVGNVLMDVRANQAHVIQSIVDGSNFTIAPGTNANFTNATIASANQLLTVPLESCEFQETYRIRCFVNTRITNLLALHSILVFILKRYNQTLLEGRGFERSTIRSQGIQIDQGEDSPEIIYMRDVSITGFVRQYWPKVPARKLDGVIVSPIKIMDGGSSPAGMSTSIINQGWEMSADDIIPE